MITSSLYLSAGIGDRVVNNSYDWSAHVGRCDMCPGVSGQVNAENPIVQDISVDSSLLSLNLEQRTLNNTVVTQYSHKLTLDRTYPSELLSNVNGA